MTASLSYIPQVPDDSSIRESVADNIAAQTYVFVSFCAFPGRVDEVRLKPLRDIIKRNTIVYHSLTHQFPVQIPRSDAVFETKLRSKPGSLACGHTGRYYPHCNRMKLRRQTSANDEQIVDLQWDYSAVWDLTVIPRFLVN